MSNLFCTNLNSRKRGIIFTYASLFIKNICNLIITPLLLRFLGCSHYGVYLVVQSIAAILMLFDFGLTNCTVKYISAYKTNNKDYLQSAFKTIFTLYILVIIFVYIGGAAIYSQIPNIYKSTLSLEEQNLLKTLLLIMFTSVGFSLIGNCYNGVLEAYEKFPFIRTLDIWGNGVRFALIIIFMLLGFNVISVIIVDASFCIIINIIKIAKGQKVINIPITLGISKSKHIKPMLKYAWFIFLATIAGQIYWRIDNLILSFIGNTSWVTINGVGTQITMVFIAFSSAIVNVFFPKIIRLVENKASNTKLTDEMIKVGRIQALVIGLLLCGFVLFGKKFVLLWVGEACIEAYYIALAIVLPLSILMVQNLGIYILQAKSLHGFRSVIMFVMATINVLLTIILVKFLGVIGAGVATGIGLLVGNVIGLNIYYHKVVGLNIKRFFKELIKGIGKALLISLCIGLLIVILFKGVSLAILMLQIVLFTLAYITVFWFVGTNKKEKQYVMEIVRDIKSFVKANREIGIETNMRLKKNNCSGCRACEHICPAKCITMLKDKEGFIYPHIDDKLCINCGKCSRICPIKNNAQNHKLVCYASWNKSNDIRLKSTSGGVFTAFAQSIIRIGGWVYGAAYNEKLQCYHMGVNCMDDIELLRCSKYVQSDMVDVMPKVKERLENCDWVLFSGTPCQVSGLKAYLEKDYERLLTMDIVCHGVPSPKVFADYLKHLEQEENSKISKYQFRHKKEGWSKATSYVLFENGKEKLIPACDDSYNRGFLKNIFLRPSCYQCMIRPKCSQADITLGDFWGIEKIDKSLFSKDGVSLIICHTLKGRKWLNRVSAKLEVYPQKIKDAALENPHILKPAIKPKNREKFWQDYLEYGYPYVKDKYLRPPSKIMRQAKVYLHKIIEWIKSKI